MADDTDDQSPPGKPVPRTVNDISPAPAVDQNNRNSLQEQGKAHEAHKEPEGRVAHAVGAGSSLYERAVGWLRTCFTRSPVLAEQQNGSAQSAAVEQEIVANVAHLRGRTVADTMIPRAQIVAIPVGISHDDLVNTIRQHKHSRMPVYRDNLDDVIGMVHIKDVAPRIGTLFTVDSIVRELLVVAPSLPVLDLLHQMRDERVHMGVVIDEHGGVDGLVTIEDLVECIVGEIADEHDDQPDELTPCQDGSFLADARMDLRDVANGMGIRLPEKDLQENDTIGGLVVTYAQRIPRRGEIITHPAGFQMELVDVNPRRINTLRLRATAPKAAS